MRQNVPQRACLIGGRVTDSTNYDDWAPTGFNVAIVLQRGSQVKAFVHSGPPPATCSAFLESIPDQGERGLEASALEPIEGNVRLTP